MSNDGRMLIITGASRGLGLHMGRRAMSCGYEVIGIARKENPEAGFPMISCDVSNFADVDAFFKKLSRGKLYGLINAAGAAAMNLAISTPPQTMSRLVNVNLLGTMYCCGIAGRLMARRKAGRIINFSTIAVALGLAGEAAYVAAKSGVEGFTRSFAREMAPFGVTVNAIAPGPVQTALIAGVPEDKISALRKRQIIQKQIVPDDVWRIAKWLLDEESEFISGEVIHVGGV